MKDNVAIVRSNYEGPHCLFENLADEIEWHEMEGFPYGGVYRGSQAIQEHVFRNIERDWREFRAVPAEFIAAGERVVTLGYYEGVSTATGKPMKAAFAHVYTLKNGKIVQFQQFADSALVARAMS